MSPNLKPGSTGRFRPTVLSDRTVPHLDREFVELQDKPEVSAIGSLVGSMEGACQRANKPYLDWPREQSVGMHVMVSHAAATT